MENTNKQDLELKIVNNDDEPDQTSCLCGAIIFTVVLLSFTSLALFNTYYSLSLYKKDITLYPYHEKYLVEVFRENDGNARLGETVILKCNFGSTNLDPSNVYFVFPFHIDIKEPSTLIKYTNKTLTLTIPHAGYNNIGEYTCVFNENGKLWKLGSIILQGFLPPRIVDINCTRYGNKEKLVCDWSTPVKFSENIVWSLNWSAGICQNVPCINYPKPYQCVFDNSLYLKSCIGNEYFTNMPYQMQVTSFTNEGHVLSPVFLINYTQY